jgi:hypothetical protein
MALGAVYASIYCATFTFFTENQHCVKQLAYLQFNMENGKEIEMIHAMAVGTVYTSVYCVTFAFLTLNQYCPIELLSQGFL